MSVSHSIPFHNRLIDNVNRDFKVDVSKDIINQFPIRREIFNFFFDLRRKETEKEKKVLMTDSLSKDRRKIGGRVIGVSRVGGRTIE